MPLDCGHHTRPAAGSGELDVEGSAWLAFDAKQ
jgi:hypothetical protein